MSFQTITSPDNQKIKDIAKLRQKKYRTREKKYITEGLRAVSEIIKKGIDCVFVVSEKFIQENPSFLDTVADKKGYIVSEKIFSSLSETENPQGVLCVTQITEPPEEIKKDSYIYLDRLQDPGNIGTIIRTAHAFGFGGVMLSGGSSDVYSGKVIRSTMSSVLYTDIYTDFSYESLFSLKEKGYKIISTALTEKSRSLYETEIPEKVVFVIGNEANGVSDEILENSDETVIIPMPGGAESLNASVASAVLMSETARRKLN